MKKLIQFILINLIISVSVFGQESLDLKDLKTPNSPGFQILDIAPSSIERPTNPKEFAASLMNLTSNGTAIPKNFALEFSPFWYVKTNKASIHKYLNIEENNKTNTFSGILRKMSFSIASIYSDSTSGSLLKNTNYIAFGVRTNLITYRTKAQSDSINSALTKYSERVRELRSHQSELDDLNNQLQNSFVKIDDLYSALENASGDEAKKKAKQAYDEALAIQTVIGSKIATISETQPDELEKSMDKDDKIQEYYDTIEKLPLFQLDVAFAYSDALPNNESENRRFNRNGIWLNAAVNAFSFDSTIKDNLTLMISARLLSDNVLEENTTDVYNRQNAFDLGFKLEYSIKKLSISYEYLKRDYSNNSSLNSKRSVGVLEYKISDGLYFTGTYGENFGEVNNLFTLFGINYGFGKSSLKTQ